MRGERSVLDVLNDIFGNLQEIVRSEIRLAKAEVADDLQSAKSSAVGLGVSLLAGVLAIVFALIAAMYALTGWLTNWGAALAVAATLAFVCVVSLTINTRRSRVRLQQKETSNGTDNRSD
jgi:hypothetical protein